MTYDIRTTHRGISGRVDIPEPLRPVVRDNLMRGEVSISRVEFTVRCHPGVKQHLSLDGEGYAVKSDGTIGKQRRTTVTVRPEQLPDGCLASILFAVREEADRGHASVVEWVTPLLDGKVDPR